MSMAAEHLFANERPLAVYFFQGHAQSGVSGGFGGLGTGVDGTLTVGTAGRRGRGGRFCFGTWI